MTNGDDGKPSSLLTTHSGYDCAQYRTRVKTVASGTARVTDDAPFCMVAATTAYVPLLQGETKHKEIHKHARVVDVSISNLFECDDLLAHACGAFLFSACN